MPQRLFVSHGLVLQSAAPSLRPCDLSTLLLQVAGGHAVDVRMLNITGVVTNAWGETPEALRESPADGDIVLLGINGSPKVVPDLNLVLGVELITLAFRNAATVILVYSQLENEAAPKPEAIEALSTAMQRCEYRILTLAPGGDLTAALVEVLGTLIDPSVQVEVDHSAVEA